jgi:ABC-type amino acid transport substrate-binding protein
MGIEAAGAAAAATAAPRARYEFLCLNITTTNLMLDLANPDPAGRECDLAISAITISTERRELGVKFAHPVAQGAVAVVVKVSSGSSSGWEFFRPFSGALWVATLITLAVFPCVLFALEFFSIRKCVRAAAVAPNVSEACYRAIWTVQHGSTFEVSSWAGKLALVGFSFFSLIIVSTYTANLAAFLTVDRLSTNFNSPADLRGLATASAPPYIPALRERMGIVAVDAAIASSADVGAALDRVASGELAALLYDEPQVLAALAERPVCDLRVMAQRLEPFDFGLAIANGTGQALVDAFSFAIVRAQEQGRLAELWQSFVELPVGSCASDAPAASASTVAVTFEDLWGLWVIMAAFALLGLGAMGGARWNKRQAWADKAAAAGAGAAGAGGAKAARHPRAPQHIASKLQERATVFDESDDEEDLV